MFDKQDAQQIIGSNLYAAPDQKVGQIGQVFLDDTTGKPEWATVNTGFFGTSETFVPLEGAQRSGSGVTVPYDKDKIKDAPNVDPEHGHISEEQEAELYRHYGLSYSESRSDSGLPGESPTAAADVAGQSGDVTGEDSMVRSEEELHVGKEQVQTGKARLRKYVVTEEENVTVPVKREKVRLETEPVGPGEAGQITEGETEVTISEERPVVAKETVAKEKVGLVKDVEEREEQVSEEVRKEQFEVEGDVEGR